VKLPQGETTSEGNMHDAQEHEWKNMRRAEALTEIERWREAIHELHQFMRYQQDHYRAWCLLSQCHYRLGEYEKALELAEKAVTKDPQQEWAYRLQACTYRKQGKSKLALAAAMEAVRVEPDEPFALQILAYSQLDCYKNLEAQQTADKLLELSPDTEMTHEVLGHVALKRQQWATAEQHFRKALELNPNASDSMNNLGWALLKKSNQGWQFTLKEQQRTEAAECFRQAIKLDPTDPIAKANLNSVNSYTTESGENKSKSKGWGWSTIFFGIIAIKAAPLFFSLVYYGVLLLAQAVNPFNQNKLHQAVNIYFIVILGTLFSLKFIKSEKGSDKFETQTTIGYPNLKIALFSFPVVIGLVFLMVDYKTFMQSITPFVIIAYFFFLCGLMFNFYKRLTLKNAGE
jgi:tetratricopeptide (TPR) repeat protein